MLYGRLDRLRDQTTTRLTRVLRTPGGTQQGRFERDASTHQYNERLARLDAVENGLCFGRLDLHGDERRYVGRLGILDDEGDQEPLLLDWRAPAARPFYLATAATPEGVRRRRHIRTSLRHVVDIDDEVLDGTVDGAAVHEGPIGRSALLSTLDADRTGRMKDIVETIQAEQDRIIRSDRTGVLVVEGGPGTGKTVVALHRAAYLLYTHRDQLANRGVLIIGPNSTFLDYVGQVLPSLGETGVVMSTVGDLFPGVRARDTEPAAVAEIKGRPAMSDVVAAAVADRQRAPGDAVEVPFGTDTLRLDPATVLAARERARGAGRQHNQARSTFVAHVLDALAEQLADRLGEDPYAEDPLGGDDAPGAGARLLEAPDVEAIRRELASDQDVLAAVDDLWPSLTPHRLLTDLYASAERLAAAAPDLGDEERALLRREEHDGWTPADVPLLDEAAELLGDDDEEVAARDRARREEEAEQVEYAQGVLDISAGSGSTDFDVDEESEILTASDLLDAEDLARRHEAGRTGTLAERAAADRTWAFGHVIVDEAQELSAMAWRMVMRRCPNRSMTIVGDPAQTGDLAGASSWELMLGPYLAERWRLERLTVNYRTSAEIMDLASDVLAALDPDRHPPQSIRTGGPPPWRLGTGDGEIGKRLAEVVAHEAEAVGDGRLAVIAPAALLDEAGTAVRAAVPDTASGDVPDLERTVVVLGVTQAKGLEFDSVVVAEPGRILAESPRGLNDLYVALTRATRRLGVVHTGDPPAVLTAAHER